MDWRYSTSRVNVSALASKDLTVDVWAVLKELSIPTVTTWSRMLDMG